MNKQKKVLNHQVFIEIISYSLFAVLLFYLISTGKYQRYVTPKMLPYLYFTLIVMAIWTIVSLSRLYQPQSKMRVAHCFILVMPAVLLLLPHVSISSEELSTKLINKSQLTNSGKNISIDAKKKQEQIDDSPSVLNSDKNEGYDAFRISGLDSKNKKITVKDEDFSLWVDEIYMNLQNYVGYQITIKGFVFKDPETMGKNEFVPARLLMSCCVADLSPYGLVCNYDSSHDLEKDSWVTVVGVIEVGQFDGRDEPRINVSSISSAKKPKDEYVYPDFE